MSDMDITVLRNTTWQPENTMDITVLRKTVYGKDLVYPDPACDKAQGLAMLANTKTFSPYQIQVIKTLGYRVVINRVQEEL